MAHVVLNLKKTIALQKRNKKQYESNLLEQKIMDHESVIKHSTGVMTLLKFDK